MKIFQSINGPQNQNRGLFHPKGHCQTEFGQSWTQFVQKSSKYKISNLAIPPNFHFQHLNSDLYNLYQNQYDNFNLKLIQLKSKRNK